MNKKYVIWDKQSNVITPIGEVLTPEQWIDLRPVAATVTTVVGGGTVNGSFFGIYDEMVDYYEKLGCDFSTATTEQEHLDLIGAFEDEQNNSSRNFVSTEERTAAAVEALVLLSMPDEQPTE